MTRFILNDRRALFAASVIVALLGATLSYIVLDPKIGFDDANITQVYGRHIAQGHGYVYNIGGERVEGSTSILWTLINVGAFYVSPTPEMILAVICLILTILTIYCAARTAQVLVQPHGSFAPFAVAAGFLVFPAFFGWMVWSLMDVTLWIFLISALFLMLTRYRDGVGGAWLPLCLIATALPITRPEGIALTTGVALIYLLQGIIRRDGSIRVALMVGLSGAASAIAATLWRLSYFGYPAPNTFYAKTSDNIVSQIVAGARYIFSYLEVAHNAMLVALLCLAAVLIIRHGTKAMQEAALVSLATLVGAITVYTVLGGDHFGSHRFMLLVIPLGLPLVMVGLRFLAGSGLLAGVLLALPFVVVGLVSTRAYVHDNGEIGLEFRIAEDGRKKGAILNSLPGDPVVGVIAAGGMRMGYDGPVQDWMGLNWTEVAHATPDAVTAPVTNHAGFNTDVFWAQPPDVFIVRSIGCPNRWIPVRGFLGEVTDYITETPEFADAFALACYQDVVFHAAKSYLQRLENAGTDIPFTVFTRP